MNQKIEHINKEFSKMTRAEKRVAVAKDTLKWMNVKGFMTIGGGGYLAFHDQVNVKECSISLQHTLQKKVGFLHSMCERRIVSCNSYGA